MERLEKRRREKGWSDFLLRWAKKREHKKKKKKIKKGGSYTRSGQTE